jgi:hypothetical protein
VTSDAVVDADLVATTVLHLAWVDQLALTVKGACWSFHFHGPKRTHSPLLTVSSIAKVTLITDTMNVTEVGGACRVLVAVVHLFKAFNLL